MNPVKELRVLTGRHRGASALVQGGERIGSSDDCDLVLTDLGLGENVTAWLQLQAARWKLALREESSPEAERGAPEYPLGGVAYLGDQAITVCDPDAPWQEASPSLTRNDRPHTADIAALPVQERAAMATAQPSAQESPDDAAHDGSRAAQEVPPDAAAPLKLRARRVSRWWWAALAVIPLFLILRAYWGMLERSAPLPAVPAVEPAPTPDAEQQRKSMREVQMALAQVDPALRLSLESTPQGAIRVSGWVPDIDTLDRVAQALGPLRPLPQLAVHALSDLEDDLDAAVREGVRGPRFEFTTSGAIRLHGLVMDTTHRDQVLASLRALVPNGVEVQDGLRVAAGQAPDIQKWFRSVGYPETTVQWREDQMQLSVQLMADQRRHLEYLLTRTDSPLFGIPFRLSLKVLSPTEKGAAQALVHINNARLPFKVHGVVGGVAPYLILSDGSRLQPGGQRGGWTLESVESDRVTLRGPRTLVLAR